MNDLPVVDAMRLPEDVRALLRPGERVRTPGGHVHVLPRFFYQVNSWPQAKAFDLAAHFTLGELMTVDCREHPRFLRDWPHYVPCSISLLARYLEAFRARAGGAPVFIAANGGYRSPAHARSAVPGPHVWAAAADIFRVGDTWLDSEDKIEKYRQMAMELGPEVYAEPYGHEPGQTDDHLHIDIGFVTYVPRDCDES